ncbi:hypothetical protein CYY_001606 [Polysphondylium violaceum]|uniref:Uncharacterized protein n=1 Tax=Polysphondylium violaceum TaxID=133409 RepID=A0A8J4Q2U3_9MYCE|nr:hypothetical protein CYY_001606 [Polysphondylium violaceum]
MSGYNELIQELLKLKNDIVIDNDQVIYKASGDSSKDNQQYNSDEIYNKLSSYFPTISINNLTNFINDLKDQIFQLEINTTRKQRQIQVDQQQEDEQEILKINNQLIDTITEYSLKYNSIIRKKDNSNDKKHDDNDDTIQQLSNSYSSIYYLYFINLFKLILKINDVDVIYNLLGNFMIDHIDDDDDDQSDIGDKITEQDENQVTVVVEEQEKDNEIKTKDNDDDDDDDDDEGAYEEFESFDGPSFTFDFHSNNNNNNNIITESDKLEIIQKKLLHLLESLSYDHISQDNVWEDYSILEDIQEICNTFVECQQVDLHLAKESIDQKLIRKLQLDQLLPQFIYLLRDRIIHKTLDIPYILPILFKILHIEIENNNDNDNNDKQLLSPFQFRTILSILDSLVNIKNHKQQQQDNIIIPNKSIESISKSILQLQSYFVDRMIFWSSMPSDQFEKINSKVELESISNIIYYYTENPLKEIDSAEWDKTILKSRLFSEFISFVVFKIQINFDENCIDFLAKCCCRSNTLANYIKRVEPFTDLVLNNQNFIQKSFHQHLIWYFILNYTTVKTSDNLNLFVKEFCLKIQNQYQIQSFNDIITSTTEGDNDKVFEKQYNQFEKLLNILILIKNNNNKNNHNNDNNNIDNIFNHSTFYQLLGQFEKDTVKAKIDQQKRDNTSLTKPQKKLLEIYNHQLQTIKTLLKSLKSDGKDK